MRRSEKKIAGEGRERQESSLSANNTQLELVFREDGNGRNENKPRLSQENGTGAF